MSQDHDEFGGKPQETKDPSFAKRSTRTDNLATTSEFMIESPRLRDRAMWLAVLRLLLAVICLAIILIHAKVALPSAGRAGLGESPFRNAYLLLVSVCALDIVYLLMLRGSGRLVSFVFVQLIIDALIITGLIYVAGGGGSYFNVLYFAVIVAAALFVSGRSSIFFASLCTTLLAVVVVLYFLGGSETIHPPFVHDTWLKDTSSFRKYMSFTLPYMIAQGTSYHLVAVLSGRLSQRLGQARILHKTLIRDMSEGVIAIDTKGKLLFVSDRARELLGFPPHVRMAGRRCDEVFRRESDREFKEALVSGEFRDHVVEVEGHRGGEKLLIRVRTSALFDDHRKRMAILADLTPMRRLRQAEKRADYLEEIAQLAASLAHEIRTPLASIRSCVQELGEPLPKNDDRTRLIEIVCRESDRLDSVVSDFLKFASVRSSRPKRCDVARILREVVTVLKCRTDRDDVRIEHDIPHPLCCMGDARQLEQVFLNVGMNAIEAMPNGGVLSVSGRIETRDGSKPEIVVTFSDTGMGIAAEVMDRIFSPFVSTKGPGRGMGLAIATRIVRAHGGLIAAESAEGRGSSFHIRLPVEGSEEVMTPSDWKQKRHEQGKTSDC